MRTSGLTLDAGALIAVEKYNDRAQALLARAQREELPLAVPACVLAQVWRGGPRQARIARMLTGSRVEVVALDEAAARVVGQMCGEGGHADIVDVSVALCAHERDHAVVTSDPDDIRAVDPRLRLIEL